MSEYENGNSFPYCRCKYKSLCIKVQNPTFVRQNITYYMVVYTEYANFGNAGNATNLIIDEPSDNWLGKEVRIEMCTEFNILWRCLRYMVQKCRIITIRPQPAQQFISSSKI